MTNIVELAAELFTEHGVDTARRVHSSQPMPTKTSLRIIGTPSMLRMAQNLFTAAKGDTDNHSDYTQFLHDLDGLLGRYSSKKQARNYDDGLDEEDGTEENELEAPTTDNEDDTE
jgi:hypothetical protein